MPEIRPLRPISHWRRGKPAIVDARMLKTQFLRQLNRCAAAGEGKGSLTRGERSDAAPNVKAAEAIGDALGVEFLKRGAAQILAEEA